ncbi:hypothetical protein DF142_00275 [Burkholderia cenocepacia]|uniref:hypothetical protein n=1 Tax=Burkholderia cenocepacia TaxID=95486 RepID=UPI000F583EA9|nr:hypothetical protein [Burkholderia cenocepacia]RQU45783.1 hypothetical protein DF142_00275 [Burkholderia cenocepacia]RQU73386.1 hypothetical protein DF140_00275 [Burkholderia cenocepacia]RQU96551.1 hypothetical protein DF040_02600 [Burkholderia cenocepacia]
MKLDVATFNAISVTIFVISAVIATCMSSFLPQIKALRTWGIGFAMMSLSILVYAASAAWHIDYLLVPAAALNLQYRLLTWSGIRILLGRRARHRTGVAISTIFCMSYGAVFVLDMSLVCRAMLLALFFVPARIMLIREVSLRQCGNLSVGRALIAVASGILAINACVPLALAWLGRGKSSMLIGSPSDTSIWYCIVFASDLLLIIGLAALAIQRIAAEKSSLAFVDRWIA